MIIHNISNFDNSQRVGNMEPKPVGPPMFEIAGVVPTPADSEKVVFDVAILCVLSFEGDW